MPGPGIHCYNRNKVLSSVIAGAKMPPENRAKLSGIIKKIKGEVEQELKLYQAYQSKQEYQIIIPDHPNISESET